MRKYNRLCLEEREEIAKRFWAGETRKDIAIRLKRNPSTISRELRRLPVGYYQASMADRRARHKHRRKPQKLKANPNLEIYIISKLRLQWSPQQIANRLRQEYPQDTTMHISHESIYTYIYILARGGLKEELVSYLRRQKKKRGLVRSDLNRRGQIPEMISIEERPKEVEKRTIPGHWESDLVMGRGNRSAIGTIVERTTRTLILVPLVKKDAESVRMAFARELKKLPKQMRISMTHDQGVEMSQHKLFTQETKIKVYFAHPKSPWERGTNENTNGLIRQYFPKRTDFTTISRKEVKKVQNLLNGRPRKALGYYTPFEMFNKLLR